MEYESEELFNKRRDHARKISKPLISDIRIVKDNEFQCHMCGNVYEKVCTDEEAMKECEENFGKEMANNADNAVICDDCYQKIDPKKHPHEVHMAQQEHFIGRN